MNKIKPVIVGIITALALIATPAFAAFTWSQGGTNNIGPYTANNVIVSDGTKFIGVATSTLGLGSGTVGSGTTGQVPFYKSNGTALTATSSIFIAQNQAVDIGTTSSVSNSSLLTVAGNAHFGTSTCPQSADLLTSPTWEFCGSDNTENGVNIALANTNPGTSAFSDIFFQNSDSLTLNTFAVLGLNSPNYNDDFYGTAFNIPNQLQLGNEQGPVTIAAAENLTGFATTTAYINFLTGGTDTSNERMRIQYDGLVGIGTQSPSAQLEVDGSTNNLFQVGANTDSGNFPVISTRFFPDSQLSVDIGDCDDYATGNCVSTDDGNGNVTVSAASALNLNAAISNVNGNLSLTGKLFDGTASAGSNGNVLQSTGSATKWVATSTLGLGGGSSLVGTTGQVAYFSGTNAAVGTSTISITTAGNVNIGATTTPNDRLLVNQPIALNNNSTENRVIEAKTAGNEIFGVGAYDNNTNPVIFIGSPNGQNAAETTRIFNGLTGQGALDFFSSFLNFSTTAGTLFTGTGATLQIQDQVNSSGASNNQSGPLEFRDYLGTISNFHIDQILNIPNSSGTIDRLAFNLNRASQSGGSPYEGMSLMYNGLNSANLGVGSTSPWAKLSVNPTINDGAEPSFVIGSSTGTQFIVTNPGKVGIGTTSPYASLSVQSNASIGDAFVVATSTGNAVFGVDNDGHQFTSGPAPVISSCGTGSGSVVGDDQSGTITTATAATACTMTFSKAYRATPTCTVSDNSTVGFADISSISTTAVTFGISSALTGGNLYYQCSYHK